MSARKSRFFTLSLAFHASAMMLPLRMALAQTQTAEDSGDSSFVRMRPIDRATVRIFALQGMAMEVHRNQTTGRNRPVAVARAGHGSGVVVDPDGFIVTAAHVVRDAQQIAIVMPGGNEGYPADVVYTDPTHDIAILRAGRTFRHYVSLPAQQPTVQLGDRIGITGYPLTPHERMPAAASGEISRLTNDGLIQLAASINPGNSGGPVIDSQGVLVGIVSSRLQPQQGAQGIAFIEPIAPAIRAFRDNIRRSRPLEGNPDMRKDLAQVVVASLRMIALGLTPDERVLNRLVTAIDTSNDTDAMALFVGYLWNSLIGVLEENNADDFSALPAQVQRTAVLRFGLALGIARRAASIDRSITRRYRIVQDVIDIGERIESNLRSTNNGAQAHQGHFSGTTVAQAAASHEETTERFGRSSFEMGGGMALDFWTAEPNGGGYFFDLTHDVLRWEPKRWVAITFASVGVGHHAAFSSLGHALTFHADIGMRVRLGSPQGSSFSLSGHYTPGGLLGIAPARSSASPSVDFVGMYLGFRVDAALYFNPIFALSVRYTDQYRPALINGLRMVSFGFALTF